MSAGPGAATDHKWVMRSTGQTGDITFPPDANTIIARRKLAGPKNTAAAFGWIKIQDLSAPATR